MGASMKRMIQPIFYLAVMICALCVAPNDALAEPLTLHQSSTVPKTITAGKTHYEFNVTNTFYFTPAKTGYYRFEDSEGKDVDDSLSRAKENGAYWAELSVYETESGGALGKNILSKTLVGAGRLTKYGTTVYFRLEAGRKYCIQYINHQRSFLVVGGIILKSGYFNLGFAEVPVGKQFKYEGVQYRVLAADRNRNRYDVAVKRATENGVRHFEKKWPWHLHEGVFDGWPYLVEPVWRGVAYCCTKIDKAAIPVAILSAKSRKSVYNISAKTLKRRSVRIMPNKAFKLATNDGHMEGEWVFSDKWSFSKVKGSKKIKVSKAGKITIAKGCRKGLYKISVKAKASRSFDSKANARYNKIFRSSARTIQLKIRVK